MAKKAARREPLQKGYKCFCGAGNRFEMYVYAHWCVSLRGECKNCKRKVRVLRGMAWPERKRKTDPANTFEPIFYTMKNP